VTPRRAISQKLVIGIVYGVAMFISGLDVSIVNVALPTIGRTFHVNPASVGAISIAYLVALAVVIPASGWLGDRLGGRSVLLGAIIAFTIASAMCGLASSESELVLFRVLQGLAGGMLAPVGLAMLYRAFPPAERLKVAAITSPLATFASVLGPAVGGVIVTTLSWRWIFFVNVPIGVLAIAFGLTFLAKTPAEPPRRFDAWGFGLGASGLGLTMYGFSEGPFLGWDSARVLGTALPGVALLIALMLFELRNSQPLIDFRLFANRLFRSANWLTVIATAFSTGALYIVTLYLQDGRGLSALNSGLCQFFRPLGYIAGAQVTSRRLLPALGPRRLITFGLLATALVFGILSFAGPTTNIWLIRTLIFVLGLAFSPVFLPIQTTGFSTISSADMGRASTMISTSRQIGGAAGVAHHTAAVVVICQTHLVGGHAVANFTAYHVAFFLTAAVTLLGVLVSLGINDADAAVTVVASRHRHTETELALNPERVLET
jgi:EmrB/QacA subfamily drug resistance transporter